MSRYRRGRGAVDNPAGRFERLRLEPEPAQEAAEERPRTTFLPDASRSVLSFNASPDVAFAASLNPYRGCEHGCAYCYARPFHEYLGLSAGLDFETRIFVKEDAPALLERALDGPGWKPQTIALSGATDPYQPVERRLRLTRRCLEILAARRNPVTVTTKNHLVTRDADLLAALAEVGAVSVAVSVTTLDDALTGILEPRTSRPRRRLEAIAALADAGVPAGVWVAPVIPAVTDHELPAVVAAGAAAGAVFAGYEVLRLPHGVAGLFSSWLGVHMPDRRDKVLNRMRAMRGGGLNDARFATRMRGEGAWAEQIAALFEVSCRRAGVRMGRPELSAAAFRRPGGTQGSLFDKG